MYCNLVVLALVRGFILWKTLFIHFINFKYPKKIVNLNLTWSPVPNIFCKIKKWVETLFTES